MAPGPVPLVAEHCYSVVGTRRWKAAMAVIAAAFVVVLLITHPGKAAQAEHGAELAVSHAWHLLHEAERENRNVRPLPLSLANTGFHSFGNQAS
ncbi:MAG TPA: hypothetical protein VJ728_15600 [Candidatus Binataceae bacterium]|nr:hypothetical protein [Candidatus Binataceae bacterium]